MSEPWHTADVAEYLGIGTSRVKRLCQRAKPHPIPHRWEGGRRVYDSDAVSAWEQERNAWWAARAREVEAKRAARQLEAVEAAAKRCEEKREAHRRALAARGVSAETLARWQGRGWL